jgi:hypothetical protein
VKREAAPALRSDVIGAILLGAIVFGCWLIANHGEERREQHVPRCVDADFGRDADRIYGRACIDSDYTIRLMACHGDDCITADGDR